MKKYILAASFVALQTINSVSAITLQEALTSAYDNDEELKSIRQDYLNEIEAFPKALSEFMPRVNARYQKSQQHSKLSGTKSEPTIKQDSDRGTKSLSISQSLFNGGSSAAGLRQANHAQKIAKASFYNSEGQLLLKEIEAYLAVYATAEKYTISKISVKANEVLLTSVRAKFKVGEATETDVASARSSFAIAEANAAASFAEHESAKANFRRLFALEPENIKIPSLAVDPNVNLDNLLNSALINNHTIIASKENINAAKAGELRQKGVLLPKVDLEISKSIEKKNEASLQSQNPNTRGLVTTLAVTVPILSQGGAEYSAIRTAKNNARKALANFNAQTKKVKAECESTVQSFMALQRQIQARDKSVKAAEIAYAGAVQEEKLGSKTLIDVIRAEEQLNKTRLERIEANKELVAQSYKLKLLTGDLTAIGMNLPVNLFNPDEEYRSVKTKIVGF